MMRVRSCDEGDSRYFHRLKPPVFIKTNKICTETLTTYLTYLTVPITFILRRIRLVEFVLQLSDQIILRVHDIQVLVLVPVPFVLLILTGAADVIEDLPQFITLGWSCRKHISVINMDTKMERGSLQKSSLVFI